MLSYARIPPTCNEVELHPMNVQPKLVKFMNENKIEPIAYCPIARGANTLKCPDISEHSTLKTCMEKYGKTGPQILLNWGIQRGHIVIPKSNNEGRLKENIESMGFTLDQEDVEAITKLDEGHRICDNYAFLGNNSIFA
jgi:alcohol dehydrogenase (NADP+)